VSHGRFAGGLLEDLVIKAVQLNCKQLLASAITDVQQLFGSRPQDTLLAPLSTIQTQLPPSSQVLVEGIASELRMLGFSVTANEISTLVSDICSDLEGFRASDPVDDVQSLLPGADLQALSAVNEISSLVLLRCGDLLNDFQADGMLQSLTGYLISNQILETDVSPPLILGPTWKWTSADFI
jgi:hypothetical protein